MPTAKVSSTSDNDQDTTVDKGGYTIKKRTSISKTKDKLATASNSFPDSRSVALLSDDEANKRSGEKGDFDLDEGEIEMGGRNYRNGRYAPPLYKDRERSSGLYEVLTRRIVAIPVVLLVLLLLLYSVKQAKDQINYAPSSASNYASKAGGKLDLDKSECIPIPGKPERQYALMIDAGSTGSRIHVYQFAFCQSKVQSLSDAAPLPTLVDEKFYQLQPGLSSFKGRPKEAANSLRPLLQHAIEDVPEKDHHCTPIAVKATAGLRLLGVRESQAILDQVKRSLDKDWPFPVLQDNGVAIMDGKDEAIYAWITINYLLGLIGPNSRKGESAAVMDLGGASTQIVFEPAFATDDVKLSPGDHVYQLDMPSGSHELYQHSHLGYGLMQARRSVNNLIAFTYTWQVAPRGVVLEWDDLTPAIEIPHPCMTKGGKKVVELDPPGRKAVSVTFVGTGAGFDACRRVVDVVMAKDALCEVEPCAFGGVYQPKMMETFGSGPIYACGFYFSDISLNIR